MVGISKDAAILIRGGGRKITWDSYGPDHLGKFGGYLVYWMTTHAQISPLVSTGFDYDSAEEAKSAMETLVQEIRSSSPVETRNIFHEKEPASVS